MEFGLSSILMGSSRTSGESYRYRSFKRIRIYRYRNMARYSEIWNYLVNRGVSGEYRHDGRSQGVNISFAKNERFAAKHRSAMNVL